jgi:hypothetical protein
MKSNSYLSISDQRDLCGDLGLECAPLISNDTFFSGELCSINGILKLAEGKSAINSKTEREGLVFRPELERTHSRIGRMAFKAISNKFLLKE